MKEKLLVDRSVEVKSILQQSLETIAQSSITRKKSGRWLVGWMGGWMEVKAVLRIAFSNLKLFDVK